jgi:hypothetical protein
LEEFDRQLNRHACCIDGLERQIGLLRAHSGSARRFSSPIVTDFRTFHDGMTTAEGFVRAQRTRRGYEMPADLSMRAQAWGQLMPALPGAPPDGGRHIAKRLQIDPRARWHPAW